MENENRKLLNFWTDLVHFYLTQVRSLPCLVTPSLLLLNLVDTRILLCCCGIIKFLHGFLKLFELLKLLHGFDKPFTCFSRPLPNKIFLKLIDRVKKLNKV